MDKLFSFYAHHPFQKLFRRLFGAVLLAAYANGADAQARVGTGENDPRIALEILSGWRSESGSHVAALKLHMAPEWVTYWRVPGDAGIPPRLSLSGSRNIKSVAFSWPRPTAETKNGLTSFVYYDQVVVPLTLTLNDPTKPARLKGKIEVGVCAEICIPVQLKFNTELPPRNRSAHLEITNAQALAAKPSSARATCKFTPSSTGMGVRIALPLAKLTGREFGIIEHSDQSLWVAPATLERKGNTLWVTTEISQQGAVPSGMQRSDLRITALGDREMVEFTGCTPPR
jgi:DsbC/DsbD-like thiol-disulfide interchange protein